MITDWINLLAFESMVIQNKARRENSHMSQGVRLRKFIPVRLDAKTERLLVDRSDQERTGMHWWELLTSVIENAS